MNDFLNESEEFFTKEKIEELILLHGGSCVKGMTYIRTEPSHKKQIIKSIICFDEKVQILVMKEFPASITYLGAHEEVLNLESNTVILGKFKAVIKNKQTEFYSPIIYFSEKTWTRVYNIMNLYKCDEKAIDFYIPGICKALNEKGYGIEYIRHSISVDNEIRIRVKSYFYYDAASVKSIRKLTKGLTSEEYDYFGPNLKLRSSEEEISISLTDLLELMRTNDIDFEDVKVNHKGISSIYDTGLFENKNI